jgi:hypothetical protein
LLSCDAIPVISAKYSCGFVPLAVLFQALRCAAMTVQQLATSPFFAKRQGYDHLLLYGVEFLGPPFASPLTLGGR